MLMAILPAWSQAAVLKGTIFDSNLEPVKAIVSLNTTPVQTIVAQNGSFSFEVPRGTYTLLAKAGNGNATETVSIVSDGTFNLDIVLFGFEEPKLEAPSAIPSAGFENQDTGIPQETAQKPAANDGWPGAIAVIAIVALAAYFLYTRRKDGHDKSRDKTPAETAKPVIIIKAPEKQEAGLTQVQETIIAELRKSEGRATQKELRKFLPFSEAKVSIDLDLLEEKGLIKKFKKGRGNVVILTDKGK